MEAGKGEGGEQGNSRGIPFKYDGSSDPGSHEARSARTTTPLARLTDTCMIESGIEDVVKGLTQALAPVAQMCTGPLRWS